MNIPIIYEDDWLLVADKPAGLLTIPAPKKTFRTLTAVLNDHLKEKRIPYRLHPCHRLDKDTSGLIIYAKGKSTQQKVMGLFKARQIKKTYLVFVRGNINNPSGRINYPIDGQAALTRYKLIENRDKYAIIEAMPWTGRTNQLRIHFKQIGHPVLGERKFAFRKDFQLKAKRLCLQAFRLEFKHPVTGQALDIRIEPEQDLKKFLAAHP